MMLRSSVVIAPAWPSSALSLHATRRGQLTLLAKAVAFASFAPPCAAPCRELGRGVARDARQSGEKRAGLANSWSRVRRGRRARQVSPLQWPPGHSEEPSRIDSPAPRTPSIHKPWEKRESPSIGGRQPGGVYPCRRGVRRTPSGPTPSLDEPNVHRQAAAGYGRLCRTIPAGRQRARRRRATSGARVGHGRRGSVNRDEAAIRKITTRVANTRRDAQA